MLFCPSCGKMLPFEAKYCPHCGHNLKDSVEQSTQIKKEAAISRICTECKMKIPERALFCPSCGVAIASMKKTKPVRELKTRHIFFAILFGLFYGVPAALLLFRDNKHAIKVLLFAGLSNTIQFAGSIFNGKVVISRVPFPNQLKYYEFLVSKRDNKIE